VMMAMMALMSEAILTKPAQVITPFGKWAKSCTHAVNSDTVLIDQMSRTVLWNKKTNAEKIVEPCAFKQNTPSYKEGGSAIADPEGWAAYAYSKSDPALTSYNGTWAVPQDPTQDVSQTLFLFTGFQNSFSAVQGRDDVVNIIQPVLQFGPSAAGGGKYWALASWYVDSNDNAFWSNLTKTAPGNTIQGNMLKDAKTGIWNISSIDVTASTITTLNIATNTSEPYAFVTLEVYTVNNCQDYPHGSVEFTDLVFAPTFSPAWTSQIQKDCNESVTITSDSDVTINF